ncbi:MAG TPA: DJ-1/PfpI family protein [Pyrinomonadaceae bacterium]|jgi:transcriptional regulator GlxA family with amidase domain
MNKKIKNFGFLLFPDLEELDLVGPWEIFSLWRDQTGEPENCLTVSETGGTVRCKKGLRIVADTDFASCPQFDALLIPGGDGRKSAAKNEKLLQFVREQAANAQAVLSVCSGAFILQAAGLLDGLRATTHWSVAQALCETGVETVEERFVCNDGNKIWTAAGVSAGIDMALAFVSHRAGEEAAGCVQLEAEYYPSPRIYGDAKVRNQVPKYIKDEAAKATLYLCRQTNC